MMPEELDSDGTLERFQVRINLDSDMGELFRWVQSLRPGSRTREVANLIRIGFAFRNQGALPDAGAVAESPGLVASLATAATARAPGKSTDEAMVNDIEAVASWDLAVMCRPPRSSQH